MKHFSNYLLLGSNEYSDVVTDSFEDMSDLTIDGYVENLDQSRTQEQNRLKPIYWHNDIEAFRDTHALICVLGTTLRKSWIENLEASKFRFGHLVHHSSVVSRRSDLGVGTLVDPGCVIAGFTQIDSHVHIGRKSSIGHHTRIHKYSTIHPGCVISGRVTIEEQVTIGTGSVITPDVKIGKGAFVAAGSVVRKNVPPNALFSEPPARVVKENYGPK